MKKMMILLLVVGLLVGACCIQVAAESLYKEDVSFSLEEPLGGPPGGSVPCGGEAGNGSGGTPG